MFSHERCKRMEPKGYRRSKIINANLIRYKENKKNLTQRAQRTQRENNKFFARSASVFSVVKILVYISTGYLSAAIFTLHIVLTKDLLLSNCCWTWVQQVVNFEFPTKNKNLNLPPNKNCSKIDTYDE